MHTFSFYANGKDHFSTVNSKVLTSLILHAGKYTKMFLTVIKSWKEKSLQATLCDYGDFNEILRASNSQNKNSPNKNSRHIT